MKQWVWLLGVSLLVLSLGGCSMLGFGDDDEEEAEEGVAREEESMLKPISTNVDPVAPLILRVVGYGAVNPKAKSKGQSKVQQRLMAIRASRLDAYRSMAERVYGAKISGSSTVRDLVVQNDSFRSYVDTFIHGARVVSADVLEDGSVETVLEMVIDAGFRNCLTTENSMRFNSDCHKPVMMNGKGLRSSRYQNMNRVQSQSSIPETNHYFVD
ncbi:MAG: LPP20 family lipoprotein [Bermanella sp.]